MQSQYIADKLHDFFDGIYVQGNSVSGLIDLDWIDENTTSQDIVDHLYDVDAFDDEYVNWYSAINYLSNEDPSLKESLEMAEECGYDLHNLDSCALATLLASRRCMDEFEDELSRIDDFFDELFLKE